MPFKLTRFKKEKIMRPFKLISLSLSLTVIFFCCKKGPEEEYPVVTEIIEDVKVVTNPDYPRDGKIRYSMEEDLSIGVAEGDEGYMLNQPFDVNVAEDGTIYILDWGDVCIKVYGKDGKHLRTVGRKGQGPGEFEFLIYMALASDGRIFIMDPVNGRVSVLDIYGKYLGGFRVEGQFREMKTDGKNRLYYSKRISQKTVEELPVTKDFQEIDTVVQIFRSEADGKDLLNFGDFKGEKYRVRRMDTGGAMSTGSQYNIVWEVSREGMLYEGLNQEYKINVFDQDGKKILTFGREYEPVMIERRMGELVRKSLMPAFDHRRAWEFDDDGNLWVSIYSENEEEVVYDVFSPQGIYLKQVVVPHMIRDIKKGKVYSILTTEEGFMAVKRSILKEIE